MSTKTTRRCDHCTTIIKEGENLWTIALIAKCNVKKDHPFPNAFASHMRNNLDNRKLAQNFHKDYCDTCMEKMGLHPKKAEAVAPKVTFEDLFRDIIAEEVQEAFDEGGR